MARTDLNTLYLGLRYLLITVVLMFIAPFSIYQAFKNQEHPLYIPVLIFGIICAIAAISLGFLGVKTITDSFFNKDKN
ncbi:MAG: putative membrane protein [Flavobacteriaceae bacterium]